MCIYFYEKWINFRSSIIIVVIVIVRCHVKCSVEIDLRNRLNFPDRAYCDVTDLEPSAKSDNRPDMVFVGFPNFCSSRLRKRKSKSTTRHGRDFLDIRRDSLNTIFVFLLIFISKNLTIQICKNVRLFLFPYKSHGFSRP